MAADFNHRRYLVTGAAGFLAGRLVRQLLETGGTVRGLVRSRSAGAALRASLPAELRDRFELVLGDFLRADDCRRAVSDCQVVHHVAAQLSGGAAPLILTNVVGTKRLIEAADAAGVKRLVLVSSIAVHHTESLRKYSVVDEAVPLDPQPHLRDPYTFSKVEQEKAAAAACKAAGLPLVIVRPGVIYGEGRESLTGRVGLRSGRLVVTTAGKQPLPYTHVENCAAAIQLAGDVKGIEGQAFNIVDDDVPSSRDVLKHYRLAGKRLTVVRVPYFLLRRLGVWNQWYHHWSTGQLPAVLTPYKVASMWKPLRYSNEAAKQVLGWQPIVGWREAAEKTLTAA